MLKRREFKPLPGGGQGVSTATPSDTETCNCCQFVDEGSTVLSDGTFTSSERQLCGQLGEMEWKVATGLIVLKFPSPDQMKLSRQVGTDNLVWTIPASAFSAQRADGTDATASLSGQSGTVTFYHRTASSDAACPCEDMAMDVDFTATLA